MLQGAPPFLRWQAKPLARPVARCTVAAYRCLPERLQQESSCPCIATLRDFVAAEDAKALGVIRPVRSSPEGHSGERAAGGFARLQGRAIQADSLRALGGAVGAGWRNQGDRAPACLAHRYPLEHVRRSCPDDALWRPRHCLSPRGRLPLSWLRWRLISRSSMTGRSSSGTPRTTRSVSPGCGRAFAVAESSTTSTTPAQSRVPPPRTRCHGEKENMDSNR